MNVGDVVWVNFPPRGGHEQAGRRPAIVLQNSVASAKLPTVIAVPLTTQQTALRFPGTVLIETDMDNGLSSDSVALVFQITAIDARHFGASLGTLAPEKLAEIQEALIALTSEPPAAL